MNEVTSYEEYRRLYNSPRMERRHDGISSRQQKRQAVKRRRLFLESIKFCKWNWASMSSDIFAVENKGLTSDVIT